MPLIRILVGLFMVSAAVSSQAAETLEREMDKRTFEQAGLHRLSEAELAFLNRYLGRADAPPEAQFGKEQVVIQKAPAKPREAVERITTHIKGSFEGWEGDTVFRLGNGQIWRQRLSGRYRYRATDPAVTIERGRFGYYLVIEETGRKIAVKRLK